MKKEDLLQKLTPDQSARLISTASAAAVAMAEYWDALHEIETAHAITLEGMTDVISSLAGYCSIPPKFGDLAAVSASEILDMLEVAA